MVLVSGVGLFATRLRASADALWALPLVLGALFTLMGYIRAVILTMRAQDERQTPVADPSEGGDNDPGVRRP